MPADPPPALDPPPGFRDATEYVYTSQAGRRLTLTGAGPTWPTDPALAAAAAAYAAKFHDLTRAAVGVGTVRGRADGGAEVELTLPASGGQRQRTALVRTPAGDGVRVTLTAAESDAGAEADFRAAVAKLAPPAGYADASPARRYLADAGPFALHVRLAAAGGLEAAGGGKQDATDELGRPFQYERMAPPVAGDALEATAPVAGGRRLVVEANDPAAAELARKLADAARPNS